MKRAAHKDAQACPDAIGGAFLEVFIAAVLAQPEHDIDAAFCDAIEVTLAAAVGSKAGSHD